MVKKTAAVGENKMGVSSVGRLLASMAVPMMISMLFQAFYNVVDSVFVAQLSEDALNAVSLAFPLQNLMIAVGVGTAVGMNALLSKSLGAGDTQKVNRAANTGIFLIFCNVAAFAVIGLLFSRLFFTVQTENTVIVEYGTQYTMICLVGSIGVFAQFCFERILQATGKTALAMCTQIIGAIINIVMDPILIFGYFGFPRLEVAGAAIATVLGQIVAAIVAFILNIKFNKEVTFSLKLVRFHGETVKDIYRVGFPSIVMQSIGSVMTFGLNKILLGFNETATAVFGAYFKLQSFIFMPVFGLNNGMVPIIAYNYGARKPARVKKTIRLSIITAVAIMAVGTLVVELFPGALLKLFNASENMLLIGEPALRIIGTHFVLAGFGIVAGAVCQAIGNPMYSTVVSVCRQLVVLIPAAWLLAQTDNLTAVWFAFPIAEVVSMMLSVVFLILTLKHSVGALEKSEK